RQCRHQHDPAAHARADQDLRPLGQRIDDRDRVLAPAADRAPGEIAARSAMPEIVEAHIAVPPPATVILQKQCFCAGHVGAKAAEEDDAGWTAYVASAGGPMEKELARVGAQHVTLPLASKNPLVIRRNRKALADLIRRGRIDIVHARSRAPAWSALSAARATGRRFVTTF